LDTKLAQRRTEHVPYDFIGIHWVPTCFRIGLLLMLPQHQTCSQAGARSRPLVQRLSEPP
jgi:hypothetical protein